MTTTADHAAAFLQAIIAEPSVDLHRLVFADYLDEHGDETALKYAADLRDPSLGPMIAELAAKLFQKTPSLREFYSVIDSIRAFLVATNGFEGAMRLVKSVSVWNKRVSI